MAINGKFWNIKNAFAFVRTRIVPKLQHLHALLFTIATSIHVWINNFGDGGKPSQTESVRTADHLCLSVKNCISSADNHSAYQEG